MTNTRILAGQGPSFRIKVPEGSGIGKVTILTSQVAKTVTLDSKTGIKFAA